MPSTRKTDPATSFAAAASVTHLTETKRAILLLLELPMTDEQLVQAYGNAVNMELAPMASPSGIRSRRKELADMNLVKATGLTKGTTGRHMIIWSKA